MEGWPLGSPSPGHSLWIETLNITTAVLDPLWLGGVVAIGILISIMVELRFSPRSSQSLT